MKKRKNKRRDLEKYLKRLDKFEKRSEKSKFRAK